LAAKRKPRQFSSSHFFRVHYICIKTSSPHQRPVSTSFVRCSAGSFAAGQRMQPRRAVLTVRNRNAGVICAAAAVETQTLKIGTRGSPLALAQAYLTRDLLKVGDSL
jgi:hypothetical protein